MKKILTPKDEKPSEKTLNFIRQFAYACKAMKLNAGLHGCQTN